MHYLGESRVIVMAIPVHITAVVHHLNALVLRTSELLLALFESNPDIGVKTGASVLILLCGARPGGSPSSLALDRNTDLPTLLSLIGEPSPSRVS